MKSVIYLILSICLLSGLVGVSCSPGNVHSLGETAKVLRETNGELAPSEVRFTVLDYKLLDSFLCGEETVYPPKDWQAFLHVKFKAVNKGEFSEKAPRVDLFYKDREMAIYVPKSCSNIDYYWHDMTLDPNYYHDGWEIFLILEGANLSKIKVEAGGHYWKLK